MVPRSITSTKWNTHSIIHCLDGKAEGAIAGTDEFLDVRPDARFDLMEETRSSGHLPTILSLLICHDQ